MACGGGSAIPGRMRSGSLTAWQPTQHHTGLLLRLLHVPQACPTHGPVASGFAGPGRVIVTQSGCRLMASHCHAPANFPDGRVQLAPLKPFCSFSCWLAHLLALAGYQVGKVGNQRRAPRRGPANWVRWFRLSTTGNYCARRSQAGAVKFNCDGAAFVVVLPRAEEAPFTVSQCQIVARLRGRNSPEAPPSIDSHALC